MINNVQYAEVTPAQAKINIQLAFVCLPVVSELEPTGCCSLFELEELELQICLKSPPAGWESSLYIKPRVWTCLLDWICHFPPSYGFHMHLIWLSDSRCCQTLSHGTFAFGLNCKFPAFRKHSLEQWISFWDYLVILTQIFSHKIAVPMSGILMVKKPQCWLMSSLKTVLEGFLVLFLFILY